MKYRNKIKKSLNKRLKNIIRILHLSQSSYRPETFHELRLNIKKVSAIFDLIHYCENDFKRKKSFKPFKIIFKKAGAVRELHVEQDLLSKHSIPYSASHQKEVKQKLKDRKEDFFNSIDTELLQNLKKGISRADSVLAGLKNSAVDQYFKEVIKGIKHLLNQKLKESQLHILRRHLKIFYYNLKGSDFKEHHVFFKELDARQTLLGKWHDCRVVIENINKSLEKSETNDLKSEQLKKAREKLLLRSKNLMKQINRRTKIEIFQE